MDYRDSVSRGLPTEVRGKSRRHRRRIPCPSTLEMPRFSQRPSSKGVSALPALEKERCSPPWSEGVSAWPALEKGRCSSPSSDEGVSARPALEKKRSLPPSSEKESSIPDWLMLDCVPRSSHGKDFRGCALASQYTSAKDLITISIRYAAPPRISCLFLDWLPNPDRST
jgi:hypothetical protein